MLRAVRERIWKIVPLPPPATRRGDRVRKQRLGLELLEERALLSGDAAGAGLIFSPAFMLSNPLGGFAAFGTSSPTGFSPATIRHAYAADQALFGSVVGDGVDQTIAIVDAYDEPTIVSDLAAFDTAFGLFAPPSFIRLNQTGGSVLPGPDPTGGGWGLETAMDVEWAHAMAPNAKIVLIEANSASASDLFTAVDTARNYPGVSVVSMSFGIAEFAGISSYDYHFLTPTGHSGVTFVAASGDYGAYNQNTSTLAVSYPAASVNVLGVGGTSLATGAGGAYAGESGWGHGSLSGFQNGSGGGISQYIAQPAYQNGVVTQSTTRRTVPDIAMVADPNTGVPVYDAFDNGATTPWQQMGGTSLATPLWAGVIAIANQGRTLSHVGALDGPSQTLPMIYGMPSADFHDVTTGNNGYAAGPGYDLVTGRGTPIVSSVVRDLTGFIGTLSVGQSITSFNGQYQLLMQSDGNLVEYGPSGALWSTNTGGNPGAVMIMQTDGNLVVYASNGTPLWSSQTGGNPNAYLTVHNDGIVGIYQAATNNLVWTGNSVALSGRTLSVGESIYSPNGHYQLLMQSDGNLVKYGPSGALWSTSTGGNPGAVMIMQTDGNLVVYASNGTPLWSSHTGGHAGAYLVIDNTGTLRIVFGATTIWVA